MCPSRCTGKVILHPCSYSDEKKSLLHKICKGDLWLICCVISFVFVTLVLCWVKLRPYSEYIVILPKCYPSPLHMRLNDRVSNFFDYCLLCSSKFPQFYFFQFCYLGIFAQCTMIIVQVQQRYNKDPNTREQRSISPMVGCCIAALYAAHSVRVGVNQPLTLYSALNIEF